MKFCIVLWKDFEFEYTIIWFSYQREPKETDLNALKTNISTKTIESVPNTAVKRGRWYSKIVVNKFLDDVGERGNPEEF